MNSLQETIQYLNLFLENQLKDSNPDANCQAAVVTLYDTYRQMGDEISVKLMEILEPLKTRILKGEPASQVVTNYLLDIASVSKLEKTCDIWAGRSEAS